ncbi:plasmid partitioning protein RepB [Methylocystis silviterrae]|uniref:plasmid partitioning protein RepB n=1 Tax=Methylocystis silviterrae TaxID=2743612 RepID=UPI001E56367F|nr:plasmid partitioning protein RepB [Methylocystis silviterrae]
MTRRNILASLLESKLAAANSPDRPNPGGKERVLAGPVKTMSLTLDRMAEESRTLQEALATGAAVVELDPECIDVSFIRDRLSGPDDAEFLVLKESLRAHGQEVPILVRPHPTRSGAYQAAYGHRRLKAAQDLGIKIKAVVRNLDDRQLIIAQGIENSARRDLTFIERAIFAKSLEDSGHDRSVIMAALSTDKTELSKLITVARALPDAIIRAIGPAPKAGRRRWLQFADLLRTRKTLIRVEAVLSEPNLPADSDARFLKAFAAAGEKGSKPARAEIWKRPDGAALARISRDPKATVLRFDEKAEPDFGAYVVERLADLYEEFRTRRA